MTDNLFLKKLLVTNRIQDHEERKVFVNVAIDVNPVTTPLTKKELIVRLTDEKDPFFLYTLRLSEEDFQSLKVQQGLLVDFGAFPQKFIDLLECCLHEEHKEIPKFVLQLNCTGASQSSVAQLNIIETNAFKHLTHLSLKFLPGSDSDIKCFLAECLKSLKDQHATLGQRLEQTESDLTLQLRQTREALATRTQELNTLKNEWSSRISEITNAHAQELNAEKDRFLQMQTNLQQKFEKERKETEKAHINIMKQMESRNYELENINKDFIDSKYKSESNIRELKSKVFILEEENLRAKQELENMRKESAMLGTDVNEREKLLNQLKTRLAVLEQEVKDKEEVMKRSTDQLATERSIKKKLEEDLEHKRHEVMKQHTSIKTLSSELVKGNDIIKKLQQDIKNVHTKLKLRTQCTSDQEKNILEKQRIIDELRKEQDNLKSMMNQKSEENKKLNESLESTLQMLDDSRKLLKTNENVINWLNKQVNESQLTRHTTFDSSNTASNFFKPTGSVPTFMNTAQGSYGISSLNKPPPSHATANSRSNVPPPSMSTPAERSASQNISPFSSGKPYTNDAFLDQKYLKGDVNSKAPLPSSYTAGPNSALSSSENKLCDAITQMILVPGERPKSQQPPLASSYFPSKIS